MKKALLFTFIITLSMQSLFAATDERTPTSCPSISSLEQVGIHKAIEGGLLGWIGVVPKNQYDTNVSWTFLIMGIGAANESEAIKVANNALPQLTFYGGPTDEKTPNEWTCFYGMDKENEAHIAVAMTPATDDFPEMLSKFKMHT